jgi:hypothetical protein
MASAVEAAGASWWVEVKLSPLAISAQVGAVREGLQGEACSAADTWPAGSTSLLPQRGGREGRARCRPPGQYKHALTPRPLGGGMGGVGPGAPRGPSTLGPSWGGGGRGEGEETSSAHDECWLGTDHCWLGTDCYHTWKVDDKNVPEASPME